MHSELHVPFPLDFCRISKRLVSEESGASPGYAAQRDGVGRVRYPRPHLILYTLFDRTIRLINSICEKNSADSFLTFIPVRLLYREYCEIEVLKLKIGLFLYCSLVYFCTRHDTKELGPIRRKRS